MSDDDNVIHVPFIPGQRIVRLPSHDGPEGKAWTFLYSDDDEPDDDEPDDD